MLDGQHGFPGSQLPQCLLDEVLVFRIGVCRGFVEYDDGGIFQDGPCQGDSLPFPSGQIRAFRSDFRIQSLRQTVYDFPALRKVECPIDFLLSGFRVSAFQILAQRRFQKMRVLKDE